MIISSIDQVSNLLVAVFISSSSISFNILFLLNKKTKVPTGIENETIQGAIIPDLTIPAPNNRKFINPNSPVVQFNENETKPKRINIIHNHFLKGVRIA